MKNLIFTVDEIEEKCKELGVSVNELCQEAKVNRSILVRWKKEEPKSFKILRKIYAVLEAMASESTIQTTPAK